MQLFSGNAKSITESDDYVKASVKAESVMRMILEDDELAEASWEETTEDGYQIWVTVNASEEERMENLSVGLLAVKLKISWSRDEKEKVMTLNTLKLIEKNM